MENLNEQVNRLTKEVEAIKNQLNFFIRNDKYFFQRDIELASGRNLKMSGVSGTKIGTATTQKIAFFGDTPVVQPSSADQAALSLDVDVSGSDTVDKLAVNANFSNIQTLVNQLRTDLVNLGLIKGSA